MREKAILQVRPPVTQSHTTTQPNGVVDLTYSTIHAHQGLHRHGRQAVAEAVRGVPHHARAQWANAYQVWSAMGDSASEPCSLLS